MGRHGTVTAATGWRASALAVILVLSSCQARSPQLSSPPPSPRPAPAPTQPRAAPVPIGSRQEFAPRACIEYAPIDRDLHRTVFVDPGHGGPDPGAMGIASHGTPVAEKTVTLAVALDLLPILRRKGYHVVLSRTDDGPVGRLLPRYLSGGLYTPDGIYADLQARVDCANAAQAQLLLAIHFDSYADPTVGGTETIYDPDRSFSRQSLRFAELVQQAILRASTRRRWGLPDRGVIPDTQLDISALTPRGAAYGHLLELGPAYPGILARASRMPGALAEPLFLSNAAEADLARSPAGQEALARSYARAIGQYFRHRLPHLRAAAAPPLGPLPGDLLIADKGNNRLLLMNVRHQIVWQFPRPGDLLPGQSFLIPDDAFFTPGDRTILATEEDDHVVREIDIRTHRIIWQYGHPGIPGSAPGYLNGPDDAYRLPNGLTTLADIRNCRILVINHAGAIVRQYGTAGNCAHDPPQAFGAPNGDTPLPDGGMLVSEIDGSWIDRLDANGHLVWAIPTSLQYPSDPQLLPNGNILVCDYTLPGRVVELDPHGRVVTSFGASSGPNLLNHPSLAIRLPNGLIALNDDWNHRVIIVNMQTQSIVWQYGTTGYYGSAPGYLDNPDGIDFLPPPGQLG